MITGSKDDTAMAAAGSDPGEIDSRRFTPGTIIGDRYRIVSFIGEGGMGEVYRADDMKVGQRVALKYLPAELSRDPAALQRLRGEVRIGRQIAHPNVCRIYDLAEVDGQPFIAMQFIDGEDLASLLRRVGRLPPEKALSIAHDICSGVAAAHDQGIIHRDLKPANIMIDSRGRALVADFGLAALAETLGGHRRPSGTPAYMAPEQLGGGKLTVRTDIYALGLILYEVFTGRRLFDGTSLDDIGRQHGASKARPSSVVKEIDTEVERVILRCLEEDPSQRIASVHLLLSSLPGGDPLTAAIAGGETPSPEQVAAAGITGELSHGRAWALFGAGVAALIAAVVVAQNSTLPGLVSEIKPPEVLTDRARAIVRNFGYGRARDRATFFRTDRAYLNWVGRKGKGAWNELAHSPPSAILFNYRESPVPLVPLNFEGQVAEDDPAEVLPGMTTVVLDHEGRLRSFQRVPPQTANAAGTKFDWSRAFIEASLDIRTFKPVEPQWTPPYGSDERTAWLGTYPNRPDIAVRVEGASRSGQPVYFHVIEPWDKPVVPAVPFSIADIAFALVTLGATVAAIIVARLNYLRGRGDVRGALRVAAFYSLCLFSYRLAVASHVTSFSDEWSIVQAMAGITLMRGAVVWLMYLAVEPFARRAWPRMLITWNRVLRGQFRDPLVGREIMIGCIAGAVILMVQQLRFPVLAALGIPSIPQNPLTSPHVTKSLIGLFSIPAYAAGFSIMAGMVVLSLLVALKVVLRNYWIALAVVWVLNSLTAVSPPIFAALFVFASYAAFFYVLHRFGLFAFVAAWCFRSALNRIPVTLDFGAWYGPQSIVILLFLLIVLGYAFRISLAGKPLFGTALEEVPAA